MLSKIIKDVAKPRNEWDKAKKMSSQASARELNTIFAGVDGEQLNLISTCTSPKIAWDIL